jgi:N-acetylglucosamine transport system substrate-binding protein
MKNKLIVFTSVAALALTLASCNGGKKPTSSSTSYTGVSSVEVYDRKNLQVRQRPTFAPGSTLRITYFTGGYGKEWLPAMAAKFEQDYPGVDVIVTGSTDVTSSLSAVLKKEPDDIYISHNIPWQTLAGQNLILNLNDLYNSTVYIDKTSNKPVSFAQRIARSALEESKLGDNYWKVPQVMGVGGIAYNKTMFDANGWNVPTTYQELVDLCETIYNAKVRNDSGDIVVPFVWSGTEQYMWDSLVYDWWVQLAGIDKYNEFLQYKSPSQYDPTVYPYQKQAWEYWYNLVAKNNKYSVPSSSGLNNLESNMAFAAGQAAMTPATMWLANEIGEETLEAFGVEIDLIPSPMLPNAKKDSNGKPIKVAYDVAGKDSIVIAKKSKNIELAQEFLRWMVEEDNARIFPENSKGILLAVDYDFDELIAEANSAWEKTVFTTMKEAIRFTNYSSNPMSFLGIIAPYINGHFYLDSFLDPVRYTPDAVFGDAKTIAETTWNDKRAEAGLS